MSLEDVFPDSPLATSLRYAISTGVPLAIPWMNAPMKIGTSFFAPPDKAKESKARFGGEGEMAFDLQSLSSTPLLFTRESSGGETEETAAASSASQYQLHADISGQIGGKLLGASARGQYDKNAAENAGTIQSSSRVEYRCGQVSLSYLPRLSDEALRLLRTSRDPANQFRAKFGDYFVGAYILGGTNVNMIAGTEASVFSSKKLNVDYEGHIGFIKASGNHYKSSQEHAEASMGNLTAYDSLDGKHVALNISHYQQALEASAQNKKLGAQLQERAGARLRQLNLISSGAELPWAQCGELCSSGLVLELLMLPWSELREYVSATVAPKE
ncbi:hypothetical protein F5884DRAFT_788776 [Xylogone sp. PMI_703]|nr:hypothetical protein F5884DRAFT_788776 [Xylogone sp. PMI_703]